MSGFSSPGHFQPSGQRATPKVRSIDSLPGHTEGAGLAASGATRAPGDKASARVLLIEDNAKLVDSLVRGLREHGYVADAALTGAAGEKQASTVAYDVVILDLMLPDRDGIEVCRSLRRSGIRAPILVLSALSATKDKVTGLDAGADDYLTKPFELDELLSRLRALMRRNQAGDATTLRYADLELDLTKRIAKRAGQVIPLTNKEFALLEFFMRKAGTVLSRVQIGEQVWDMNFDPSSNVIDVYVSMLRRKIDKGFPAALIHTVVGTGYTFSEKSPA
ncbi:MAG TPA: response regulator transcription factor [Phycisphaerales bacterium]|nr:response regulator transcription factor [Phycisphaerales bacterium]